MRQVNRRPVSLALVTFLTLVRFFVGTPQADARNVVDESGGSDVDGVNLKIRASLTADEVSGSAPLVSAVVQATGPAPALTPLFLVRARRGGPNVRTAPNDAASAYSGLYYDTYLPVLGQVTDASGVVWYSVQLWGALAGWIRADQTETGDPPVPTPEPASASSGTVPGNSSAASSDVVALVASGQLRDEYVLRQAADTASAALGLLEPGESVAVQAWRADAAGSIWYHVKASDGDGWVWAGGVDLKTSEAFPRRTNDSRVPFVQGKGMWLPLPLLEMASPEAIVGAAHSLGLTHIYLEAGDSASGFYGQKQAERLLAAAHRSGIRVIAWILTSLDDLPTDLKLCEQIARYHAATGDGFDGIAPDVEFNMDSDDVRAFSEILRADLGNQALIVGIIYPVGTIIAQKHPVAGILSRSVDALAPMTYWHDEKRAFDASEINDFIVGAVADIHNAVGDPKYPVEIIGQSYDAFSRNGAGQFSPTGDEVAAALTAAREGGAFAVSLFQWGTTTPSEWNALRNLGWPTKP
jgi:hypothetical protein